eukprot:comp24494_c0_seq1/m.46750 comp24494_c0_seq1/g.46750  ORF comp24494_c0_seq1/g.46750 comp24494_c0_seq1/m.46750 type:complete len:158 (-) comp24494_c0_seq1:132-605(-)
MSDFDSVSAPKKSDSTAANLFYAVGLAGLYGFLHVKAKGIYLDTTSIVVAAVSVLITFYVLFISYGKHIENVKIQLSLAQRGKGSKQTGEDEAAMHDAAVSISHLYLNTLFTMLSLVFTFFMFKETSAQVNLALSGTSAAVIVMLFASVKPSKEKYV